MTAEAEKRRADAPLSHNVRPFLVDLFLDAVRLLGLRGTLIVGAAVLFQLLFLA